MANLLIHNFLENSAACYPDKFAVIHDGQRMTYAHLNAQADNLARHLLAQGISKGDRIVLLFENCTDYIIAYYAILKAGAVAAPLNPGLKPTGLQYLLNHLEPSAIITNSKSERLLKAVELNHLNLKTIFIRTPKQRWSDTPFKVLTLEETTTPVPQSDPAGAVSYSSCLSRPTLSEKTGVSAIVEPKLLRGPMANILPDALGSIVYTSGSTGEPKGVMLSHANIVANTNSICQSLSITSSDIQMVVLPFFYVMGKSLLNTHIAAGGTVVLNNRFMYPADVLNQMIDERVTSFSGVPSTYAYLLNRSPLVSFKEQLTHLRYCSQAGGHMAKALKLALRRALPTHTQIYIMYGATEASARLTCLPPAYFESKIESIGHPIPNVTIRVLDERKQAVPNGTQGTLVASGPNIMRGYWKAHRDTERVLSHEGYTTGDLGYKDTDGFLFLTGRKDGLLKVSGHRINPTEIEDYLLSTDLLIETVVIGIPDEQKGSQLVALVVPKVNSLKQQTLLEACAKGLPKHKMPTKVITLRALPKNANGKIDRQACTQLALNISAP